ncbi:MAG: carboxypeptidase regulatory-like domain-containing protein, partial [Planctomycetota bacterium]
MAIAALLVVAAGGAGGFWYVQPRGQSYWTDGETVRQPVDNTQPRDILWQPPASLSELLSIGDDDYEPRLSWDGLTLYFVRGKAGANAEIWTATRTPAGWTAAAPLAGINSPDDDLGPAPSADGRDLYFYSNRSVGCGGYDIWVARHADGGWQAPTNLGPAVNSEFNEYGPAVSPDGRTLYFASNRPLPDDPRQPDPAAWPATVREDLFRRTYDLYAAELTEAGPQLARPLTALNTLANEGAPCVSPAGDFLYFASDRPGGLGGFDLYRTRRLRGVFQPPENLAAPVNSPANELDPGLTALGYALYFSSDRVVSTPPAMAPAPVVAAPRHAPSSTQPANKYHLFYTSSREVFAVTEVRPRAPFDWAGLWRAIGPNLLWALLGLLLLLLLLALIRDARRRRLSLLARCLLASVAAHALLLFLLNFWEVTAGIGEFVRRRGGIQVALVPAAQAGELAAQIRAGLGELAAPAPAALNVAPAGPPEAELAAAAPAMIEVARTDLLANVAITSVEPREAPPGESRAAPTDPVPVVPTAPPRLPLALPADANPRLVADEPALTPVTVLRETSVPAATVPLPTLVAHSVAAPMPGLSSAVPEATFAPVDFARDAVPGERAIIEPQQAAESSAVPPAARYREPMLDLPLPAEQVVPANADEHDAAPVTRAPTAFAGGTRAPADLPAASVSPPAARRDALHSAVPPPVDQGAPVSFAPLPSAVPAEDRSVFRLPTGFSAPLELAAAGAAPLAQLALPSERAMAPSGSELAAAEEVERGAGAARSAAAQAPVPHAPAAALNAAAHAAAAHAALPVENCTAAGANVDTLAARAVDPVDAALPVGRTPTAVVSAALIPASAPAAALPLRLPDDLPPATDQFAQRQPEQREQVLAERGGSPETEAAVARALRWLAAHQSADGHWDGKQFDAGCSACGGETSYDVNVALTSLSLLCFLGAGHTPAADGPYRGTVSRAVTWLLRQQAADGDLRHGETMYSHGIAAIALCEACGMTSDPRLADPARRAVDFILRARNRTTSGWRYAPGDDGDTSVLGWQMMALKSANLAGLPVPAEAFAAAERWLARVEDPDRPGLYAYRPGEPASASMTAEALFVRQLLGAPRDDARTRNAIEFLAEHLPQWGPSTNTYYWYYATLAHFHHGGAPWTRWNTALQRELLAHQATGGPAAGSWPPEGEWAAVGGRVYQTALCTLMLEVYYRYLPLYAPDQPAPTPGVIQGLVTDARTQQPIAGARIRLDLAGAGREVTTDVRGHYELHVPDVPDFFAVSATHPRYVPQSQNASAADLRQRGLTLDFALEPDSNGSVVIEAVPDVHHLGNDRFEGAVNSQFQKD